MATLQGWRTDPGPRAARLLCGAALLVTAAPAFAQGSGNDGINEATTIDRDRIDRQVPQLPDATPVEEPAQGPAEVAASAGGADNIRLTRVRYDGSTLPAETLDAAAAPFIGQPLNRETLQKIANAVSAAYAKSDIAFYGVSIPAQNPAGGELTVKVLEGRIARYSIVKETRSTPTRLIGKQVRRLIEDVPTHRRQLERTLSLLRDIPGQTVEPQVRKTDVPGELALDLDVKRNQLEFTVNINNRGVTNVTSDVQVQVIVAANGVLREGDTTRLSAYVPFNPDRYQHYSLAHSTPLGSNGTRLTLSGAYVHTRTYTNIEGDAKQAGITISHPLIRSYRKNLTISASLDGTNSENYFLDTQFGGFKTRAARLAAAWSSVGKTGGYAVAASLSQGIDGLGAEPIAGYSVAGFRKGTVQLTGVKKLGDRVSARAAVLGQYSDSLLPTTERFSLGGPGSGSASYQGVVTAESALAGSLELTWKMVGPSDSTLGVSLFGFADGGLGNSLARPVYAIPERDYSLASAGAGVRISPAKGWIGSAQIAFPLDEPLPGTDDGARFLFSISKVM